MYDPVPDVQTEHACAIVLCAQVKSSYSVKLSATNVVVIVPVPDNTSKTKILVTAGKAKYDATKKGLVWKVRPRCWPGCERL